MARFTADLAFFGILPFLKHLLRLYKTVGIRFEPVTLLQVTFPAGLIPDQFSLSILGKP
jgi:hypothetical protein